VRLQVGLTEAQASASLQTDWVNPFNISPKVKVVAPVSLGVIIDYAAATYPSGLNFQGGFQVGETALHAAFEVGENPQDGVVLVRADNLGIKDIVSFVSTVIEHELPMPAEDFLYFKDLFLGISTGGTIASVYYPPGVTFNADMLIFGKELQFHCEVDKALPGFKLHAEMDAFTLGPLTVSGSTTPNPTVDLEFGTKLQHLLVDGKIVLFDLEAPTTIKVDMVPLDVTFDAMLKFCDLLFFKIDAHVVGQVKSLKDIIKEDFSISADFEQSILDHMMALANTYMATAKKATDEGLESAKTKLTDVQKDYDDHLAQAKRDLNDAKAKWDKKSADVQAVVDAQKKMILADEQSKRDDVARAQAVFNQKIADLTSSLNSAKASGAKQIQDAKDHLTGVTNDANKRGELLMCRLA